ncbi:MAG TPA: NAD(P)-dependent oxidoreductase, partial [Candidatus Acidoferrum sp.]|nr:NAD(P)-dependent oxidoreductase [Candidatus Acidoferrum sp.]
MGRTLAKGLSQKMNKPRLLVIGARGFVGNYVVRSAAERFEVIRGDRGAGQEPGRVSVDVSDPVSVDRAFDQVRPDAVALLAAIADIDVCEASPKRAYATNTRGAENVAQACARSAARLLFTSTGAVFDGKKHGYTEEDAVSPVSVYGKTKVEAERIVASVQPNSVILRFSLVVGFASHQGTNAVLDKLVRSWKSGETLSFSTKESRNPIDVGSLAKIISELLANEKVSGVYHTGSSDSVTRYGLAKRLAARAGFPT